MKTKKKKILKKKRKRKDKENKKTKKKQKKSSPAAKAKKAPKMPKKDPNEPKRPLSSFMIFGNKHRAEIKATNPNVSFGEVGKLLGQKWKAISEEEKAEMVKEAAELKAKYVVVYQTYKESDERKQWEAAMMSKFGQIPGVKGAKKKSAGGKGGKKSKKKDGPKRAVGAYAYFMKGERGTIKAANPEATFGELAGLVSAAWKALDEDGKKPFVTLAEEDKKRAKIDKDAWELKEKKEKEERGEVSSESEDTSSESDSSDSDDGSGKD